MFLNNQDNYIIKSSFDIIPVIFKLFSFKLVFLLTLPNSIIA